MKKIDWQYTLGEILIVIIGISIAFSLNKCASDSENEAQKLQYLNSMRNDLEADKATLEANLISIKDKLKNAQKVVTILTTKNSSEKRDYVLKVFDIAKLIDFAPNDITYQTLINSGDLKLIDDFSLKAAIEKHYSEYDIILKDYERMEIINKDYLGNYFIHKTDYQAIRQGKPGFEDEILLRNIIQSITGALYLKLQTTQRGIENCDTLLKLID